MSSIVGEWVSLPKRFLVIWQLFDGKQDWQLSGAKLPAYELDVVSEVDEFVMLGWYVTSVFGDQNVNFLLLCFIVRTDLFNLLCIVSSYMEVKNMEINHACNIWLMITVTKVFKYWRSHSSWKEFNMSSLVLPGPSCLAGVLVFSSFRWRVYNIHHCLCALFHYKLYFIISPSSSHRKFWML